MLLLLFYYWDNVNTTEKIHVFMALDGYVLNLERGIFSTFLNAYYMIMYLLSFGKTLMNMTYSLSF